MPHAVAVAKLLQALGKGETRARTQVMRPTTVILQCPHTHQSPETHRQRRVLAAAAAVQTPKFCLWGGWSRIAFQRVLRGWWRSASCLTLSSRPTAAQRTGKKKKKEGGGAVLLVVSLTPESRWANIYRRPSLCTSSASATPGNRQKYLLQLPLQAWLLSRAEAVHPRTRLHRSAIAQCPTQAQATTKRLATRRRRQKYHFKLSLQLLTQPLPTRRRQKNNSKLLARLVSLLARRTGNRVAHRVPPG